MQRSEKCIFDGFSQFVATKLASQKFNALWWFRLISVQRPMFPFIDFTAFAVMLSELSDNFLS